MQVRDPSIEKKLNSEMLKKMEKEVKAGNGKPAKKERELIEKQNKAENQAQEKMEKKQKKQLEQEEKRWPQRQAEHRWAQQMKEALKDLERRFVIQRWVEQREDSQEPRAQRLAAELKEAEKKQADKMQAVQRWKEWRQTHIAVWELEQRREEFNASKKKRDLQKTRTPRKQVLEFPTIWEELNIMNDLVEEIGRASCRERV